MISSPNQSGVCHLYSVSINSYFSIKHLKRYTALSLSWKRHDRVLRNLPYHGLYMSQYWIQVSASIMAIQTGFNLHPQASEIRISDYCGLFFTNAHRVFATSLNPLRKNILMTAILVNISYFMLRTDILIGRKGHGCWRQYRAYCHVNFNYPHTLNHWQ